MELGQFIQENGTVSSFQRHRHVFMQGDEDRSLYVVKEGLLKAYYLLDEGKETIKSFLFPDDIIGSMTAAFSAQQCSFSLLCLQDCVLIRIPFDKLYECVQAQPELALRVIDLLLNFSMKKERREYELLCLSAEERYQMLLERSPEISDYVTQNDIARYLGITPVALSRIKKRLR
ncbi:MAG: Crp/Fnr family transcriptional regulator [Methyloligellaceae bacterium]